MKFGLIRERKNPPDKRVVLTPEACVAVQEKFPDAEIIVESSPIRVFKDEEYEALGIKVQEDVSDCDVLLGVKEVPLDALIPNKKYFFFSHTIKQQPYNRKLLQAILNKNIELHDHEVIVKENGSRVVAFGRYAGIVGAYNGIRAYGMKYKIFDLPKAESLKDKKELDTTLENIKLPNVKIVLTGKGRVGNGAREVLEQLNIRKVNVKEFLNQTFEEPVFVQLDVLDYNRRKDGKVISKKDFYQNAEAYDSNFMRFAEIADIYIAGHYWDDKAPFIFTREDMKQDNFNIKIVADISCDIDGPVACTIEPSTIAEPLYGYDVKSESRVDFFEEESIGVMAVDNLPCELPRDASEGFGNMFIEYVFPAFFNGDKDGFLERSLMTSNKELTERFNYLENYVSLNV